MSRIDETILAKKEKRSQLESAGVDVHPHSFDKKQTIQYCIKAKGEKVQTAGRIRSIRTHGRVSFLDLQDSTGRIQVMLREEEVGKEQFKLLTHIDSGDFLGVRGEVTTTRTNEITIKASQFTFLGKTLRPIPTEWNSAADKEVRFRKRYLDMLVHPLTKKILDARWLITRELRRYLEDRHDFVEVETPILQPLYGGTNAKPFTTYMNALDSNFYLRLAPELYLKRLVVGGYERVYEVARNFRNEGLDQTHQPEFTMVEWYEAYADYNRMIDVAEGLIKHLTKKLHGQTKIQVGEKEIDVSGKWPRITILEALKKYLKIDFESLSDDQVNEMLSKYNINLIGEYSRGKALFALFDKLVPPHLIQPTWITDYPREVSPLSKKHRSNPQLAERFECYIGGKEIADGWSEIVDSVDQRKIFEGEQKRMRAGDDEAHPLDEDFLEAMEYGMPPLGGIGIGMDRLVMFLTNTWSIKEVIAFPTLKPLHKVDDREKVSISKPLTVKKTKVGSKSTKLPSRDQSEKLLKKYIENDKLLHHCHMVAAAMEAYAKELGEDSELWYQAGLLHDLDWEKYPDEHPNKAVNEILVDYPEELINAIRAHAPSRTGVEPETALERYLFACDELSGLMHAVSLMRPNGFSDMKAKSVKKKIKDKSFAANVSREDIHQGFELTGKTPDEHITFLIEVYKN